MRFKTELHGGYSQVIQGQFTSLLFHCVAVFEDVLPCTDNMESTASFRCGDCDHEWEGKPTWKRESPPRCSECNATGGTIQILNEPSPESDTGEAVEAELVSRYRDGEDLLAPVESGDATLEDVQEVKAHLEALDKIVVLDRAELNRREEEAYNRGRESREDEIKSLKTNIQNLKRQVSQREADLQSQGQSHQFLSQRYQQVQEENRELTERIRELEDVAEELKMERWRRERAEESKEAFVEKVRDDLEKIEAEMEKLNEELRQEKRKSREKDERIKALEELLVEDMVQVAATVQTVQPTGVGLGAELARKWMQEAQ